MDLKNYTNFVVIGDYWYFNERSNENNAMRVRISKNADEFTLEKIYWLKNLQI
jgi:hypothetical protein